MTSNGNRYKPKESSTLQRTTAAAAHYRLVYGSETYFADHITKSRAAEQQAPIHISTTSRRAGFIADVHNGSKLLLRLVVESTSFYWLQPFLLLPIESPINISLPFIPSLVVGQCFCARNVLTVCSLRHMNRRKEIVQLRLLFRYQEHRNQFSCHFSAISHRGRLNDVIIIAAKQQLRCTAKILLNGKPSQQNEKFFWCTDKKVAKLTFLMPNEHRKSLQLQNIKR